MRVSFKSLIRSSALLLLAGVPARAGHWDRIEAVGAYAGTGMAGVRLADYGIYNARYGVGVGTRLIDVRFETWDLRRRGLPDASFHGMIIPFPLEGRVALASWEGKPYIAGTSAESTIGRVELYGWYCPWTTFAFINHVETDIIGQRSRVNLSDRIMGETWDWGLRYDSGHLWGLSAGRSEFRTKDKGVYRSRHDGRWYAAGYVYIGRTHGKTVGGNPLNLFRDAGFKICRAFGRCGVIED